MRFVGNDEPHTCVTCGRQARGFGVTVKGLAGGRWGMCSMPCMWAFENAERDQMKLTDLEIKAIERALSDIGAYVAEIERGRPISAWERDEVLGLVRKCWDACREQMQVMGERNPDDPPF